MAGYAQTRSGRRVVFAVAVGNVPSSSPLEFFDVVNDQGRMVVAIQQRL